MSNPKSKKPSKEQNKPEPVKKSLLELAGNHKGTKVTIQNKDFYVQDLTLMDCLVLLTKCGDVLSIFIKMSQELEGDGVEMFLVSLTMIPNVREKIATFFSVCCKADDYADYFERPTDEELIELIHAVQKEVDFGRLQENFSKLDLPSILSMTSTK